jgi:serine phosphatase RsbU (regulator of sigma subunit)
VIENQKEDLEIQKSLVDEKNKDITDSIRYARSIQKAILPEKEYGRKLLPEHFILFKPKDIVSGDFYWITENKGKVFFAVCDCTGHGVPGAFMSMIGSSLLNEVVNEKGINTPGAIFDEVRSGFINALKQTTDDVQQKDGMDAILCSLDQNRKLEFAAAYNPLFLIRDGELRDYKADAQPVGFHQGVETPFTNQELTLVKNDVIYLLSDGFQDQFGGPKGKKFKVRKLKNLLLNIYSLPMADQFQKLTEVFDEWKGDLDQVDDVCIMGMRI